MRQIIYSSQPKPEANPLLDTARAILKTSLINNDKRGLTGFLLFSTAWFIQVLEGDDTAVGTLFDRIRRDGRHANVGTIFDRTIRARSFPDWQMGAAVLGPDTEEIFLRHGLSEARRADTLSWFGILSLAMDLSDHQRLTRCARTS